MVVAPETWCGSGRTVRVVAARVLARATSAGMLLRRLGKASGRTRRWSPKEAALGGRSNNSSSAQGKPLSPVMLHVSIVEVRHILLLAALLSGVKGNPSFRDLEKEFTEYLGSGWRCTARPINPTQYTMRFPSAKEVDKALFYGKRMEMKTFNAIRNLSPWSAVVGTSGMLHKAWVRVRNIPPEKRNDKHAAYAGSLVGVTLEVDQATLHKPEFCRILLGCRDIDNLPESAEGVLGDFFYIFSYEIESVVFQGPPVVRNVVTVTNTFTPPSPKRARTENYSAMSATSADGYASTDQSVGTGFGRTHVHVLETISEHESEEESEYDSELLIDSIARENRDKHAKMDKGEPAVVNTGLDAGIAIGEITEKGYVHVLAHVTPVVEKERISPDPGRTSKQLVPSYVAAVMGLAWPAAPVVTEVGMNEAIGEEEHAAYYVQSPSPSSTEKEDVPPTEKLVPPVDDRRDNLRDPKDDHFSGKRYLEKDK
ncbi:hypothetical protein ACQ4PT_054455 [Festuca glaucescens]